jgi:dephospho-CoA kinase
MNATVWSILFLSLDAPLLIETKLHKWVNKVILVIVDDEIQLERLKERNQFDDQQAKNRIASQMPTKEKIKVADFVIDNSGTLERTEEQVSSVISKIQPGLISRFVFHSFRIALLVSCLYLGTLAIRLF